MPDLPAPSLTVEYALAVVSTVVGLFLTQGLIDNGTAKLISGLAVVVVPVALVAIQAAVKSKAHAANVHARALRG